MGSSFHRKGPPNIVSDPELQDADWWLTFTVAACNVMGSHVGDPEDCAGARGLLDYKHPEHGAVTYAYVMTDRTFVFFADGTKWRFKNPDRTNSKGFGKTVITYDKTGFFMPGEYTLSPIPRSAKMGMRKQYPNAGGNAPDRKKPGRRRETGTKLHRGTWLKEGEAR